MKRLIIMFLLFPSLLFAAPPSRVYTYSSGNVISPDEVTANEDAIFNYLNRGVDTFSGYLTTDNILDGTLTNADISGTAGIVDTKLATISTAGKVNASALTGDISSSNLNGVLLPSGAVFFMLSGSCPSGTTDVTATYSNKFIKVNATQGTSSGVVLTGTTAGHTLTEAELPAHTHTIAAVSHNLEETPGSYLKSGTVSDAQNTTTGSVGSNSAHSHTISSATTLEPASITCKACLVN